MNRAIGPFWIFDFGFSIETIRNRSGLYRARWQVEWFFRWIKQHLHIRAFYGTSENAVKTQVWTAIIAGSGTAPPNQWIDPQSLNHPDEPMARWFNPPSLHHPIS